MKKRLIKFLVFILVLGTCFIWQSPTPSHAVELNLTPSVNVNGTEVECGTSHNFIYHINVDTTAASITISPSNDIYIISLDTNPSVLYYTPFSQVFNITQGAHNELNMSVYSEFVSDEHGGTVRREEHYMLQFIIPTDDSSSSGGSSGGSSIDPTTPVETTVDPTTNTVVVSVSETQLASLFAMLQEDQTQIKLAIIKIPKVTGLDKYGIQLPYSAFTASNDSGIRLETEIGTLTLMDTMLQNVVQTTDLQNVKFNMGYVDTATLSAEDQATIGNHPIISLTMELDGVTSEWNNPDSPVIVSVHYSPTTEELANPELIVVYYIDGQGNLNAIPNATYDSTTGCMVFTTTHFSDYAIAYVDKSFTDITDQNVKHAVEVLAAKSVVNGKYGSIFAPMSEVTRAEFITMLSRAFEFNTEFTNTFADVDSSKYYYKPVGMAEEMNVINGVSDTQFNPTGLLTKKQVETIVDNLVKAKGVTIDETTLAALLSGIDDSGGITRDEIGVLIYNLM